MFLILWLTLFSFSQDKIVIDVSGKSGGNGTTGRPGTSQGKRVEGEAGGNGQSGGAGGRARLAVGFSDETHQMVFIRGKINRPDGETNIDQKIETSKFTGLLVLSNGGHGGAGGNGGDGGDGQPGKNAQDGKRMGFGLNGGDGEDGGDGTDAGPGGRAGDGGDGGDVRIILDPGAEILAPMIELESKPGNGGDGGVGGRGGRAGPGGRGGYGACDAGSGLDAVKIPQCGSNGRNGRSGNNGNPGRSGVSGKNGRAGSMSLKKSDGTSLPDPYRIVLTHLEYEDANSDGILEPGEPLTIKSLQWINRGEQTLPPGQLRLSILSQVYEIKDQPPLRENLSQRLAFPQQFVVNLPLIEDFWTPPFEIRLDNLRIPLEINPTLKIERPLKLTLLPAILRPTTLKRSPTFQLRVTNSSKTVWNEPNGPTVSVKLFPLKDSNGVPAKVLVVPETEARVLDKEVIIPLSVLRGHKMLRKKVQLQIPENWKTGERYSLNAQLFTANDKTPMPLQSALLVYSTDIKDQFTIEDDSEPNISCEFKRSWWSYDIKKFRISKDKNSMTLKVQFTLKDSNEASPIYEVEYSSLRTGLKKSLLDQKKLTDVQILELLKVVDLSDPEKSSWRIDSCDSPDEEVLDEDI